MAVVLRIGLGVIWTLNLIFVVVPQNAFFPTFGPTAAAYAPTSWGGPTMANFVAAHSLFFAWAIAAATGYLAVAFLLGLSTRLACGVGIAFSGALLVAQFGLTFRIPGGTDVGPHPLYLLIYSVLLFGRVGQRLSIDSWVRARGTIDGLRRVRAWDRAGSAKTRRTTAPSVVLGPSPCELNPADERPIIPYDRNGVMPPRPHAAGP